MSKVFLMGVGTQGLSVEQMAVLNSCGLVVAGDRHLPLVQGLAAEKMSVTPVDPVLAAMRQRLASADVGVLASGDPLFFGIGRRLLHEFGPEQVEILPTLSSMQEACARFKVPWDDVAMVSLHGRATSHVPALLLKSKKTFVFTDRRNSPASLARQLVEYLDLVGARDILQGCRMYVAENLGAADERLVAGSLQEIAGQRFADLNVLLLVRPQTPGQTTGVFGLSEEGIVHSRGLITKDEVRAVALHRLRLPARGVLWDIGAGSGSVALEAARLNPGLVVYAVEGNEEEVANVKNNIRRYGCYNIVPVHGRAPVALQDLPDPDRVFVGGSGGQLPEIIAAAAERLPVGGRLVVNGVLEKTVAAAPKLMADQGLSVETSRVRIERNSFPETGPGKVFNPITIMVGKK